MKPILLFIIAISCTALLFTSCESDMDKGGTSGGGKEDPENAASISRPVINEIELPADSLSYNIGKLSDVE